MHHTTKAMSLGIVDSAKGKESYVALFTEDRGRIMARTSGMQSLLSKKRLYLQGNYLVEVTLYQKNPGSFYTLTEVTPIALLLDYVSFPEGVYDLQVYMMLLRKLLPEAEKESTLFLSLMTALPCMQTNSLDTIYVWIVLQTLKHLGYAGFANRCMECNSSFDDEVHYTSQWSFMCAACASKKEGTLKVPKKILKYIMVAFTLDFASYSSIAMTVKDRAQARSILESYVEIL